MKIFLLKSALIPCLCVCALAQGPSIAPEHAAMTAIRPDAIRAYMRFLSDPLLQGRDTGTPGHQTAALYVATQLEAAGLHPAGVNGSWYQTVPLRKSVADDGKSSLELVTKSGEQTLVSLKDYVFYADLNRTDASPQAPIQPFPWCSPKAGEPLQYDPAGEVPSLKIPHFPHPWRQCDAFLNWFHYCG